MARTKVFDEEATLNKALDLFNARGYNGTSAQDLVDELGISRSSLYDTFGDKHTLFIRALQLYRSEMSNDMIEMLDKSQNVEQAIIDTFRFVTTESLKDKLSKGCFMVNSTIEMAPHDSEVSEIINANMQDIEDALFRAIKKGQDEGCFTTHHTARSLARFLFNSISGLRVAAKSGADKKVFDDIVRITLSALKA